MPAKMKKNCNKKWSKCTVSEQVPSAFFGCTKAERVIRKLDDLIAQGAVRQEGPIEEQLRKCPEAFQAGELIGKMCDSLKYSHDQVGDERYLPPAGAVMPPLV
jgi:hypothetical protein